MIDLVLEALLGPLLSAMIPGRDPISDRRGAERRARSYASGGEVLVPFWLLDAPDGPALPPAERAGLTGMRAKVVENP